MPVRLSYKRETREQRRRARLYLAATAVLIIAGAVVPACVTGIMHQRAHERSLQAEFTWRRWYEHTGFNWNELSLNTGLPKWNDGRCQFMTNFGRAGVEKMARLFFEPAMRAAAPNANGRECLTYDDNGANPCWRTRNRGRVPLLEAAVVFMARLTREDPWETLAEGLGGKHVSRYKLLFIELTQVLYDYWYSRLTDVRNYEAHLAGWANLVERKTNGSPRIIAFLDGTWLAVAKPGGDDNFQRSRRNSWFENEGGRRRPVL